MAANQKKLADSPARQYATGTEAQALTSHLDDVEGVAVHFAAHLISVRMFDSCCGSIARPRPAISPASESGEKTEPMSEDEETMLDLVLGSAALIARFRETRRRTGFALNDKVFVDILNRCERLHDVALAHKEVCKDGSIGVPDPQKVRSQ